MRFLTALGILVLCAPVFAATADSDSADVELTIESYCFIEYDSTVFALSITGGGADDSKTHGFTANANFAYKVTGALTPPTTPAGVPGTWDWEFGDTTKELTSPAGTAIDDAVTVEVTGITLANGNGNWTGGSMVISLSEDSP